MQNNLMLCVRLAACTGAVVFAVLAVLFAYDKKRLPVCLGILFAVCFALEQLPVPIGAAGEILRVIRMADAVTLDRVFAGSFRPFWCICFCSCSAGECPMTRLTRSFAGF